MGQGSGAARTHRSLIIGGARPNRRLRDRQSVTTLTGGTLEIHALSPSSHAVDHDGDIVVRIVGTMLAELFCFGMLRGSQELETLLSFVNRRCSNAWSRGVPVEIAPFRSRWTLTNVAM